MQFKKFSNNPIVRGQGICDPHIHIFRGKAYLYASHDRSPSNTSWLMDDWTIWSSENLVDWELESTFRPEDTYLGRCERCWAVDVAERNGKYYLYFSYGQDETGVAVSDHPGKGFQDALGKPLLPKGLTSTHQYDPTVFIDDDSNKTPYLIWGCGYHGDGYKIARLNEDMISLAEEPRNILIDQQTAWDDKSFVHKKNGLYYLSWASHYATAPSIEGPYTYRGNFGVAFDHGSFFEFNGQSFFAYGTFDSSDYYRCSHICYIHYRENGEIVADQMIANFGVGFYDANWNQIETAWYLKGHLVAKRENPYLGFDVVILDQQSYLYFPNVRNMEQNMCISFHLLNYTSNNAVIQVRENSVSGPILGECPIPLASYAREYKFSTYPLKNTAGSKDIYLTFKGDGQEILRLNWLKFSPLS